MVLAFSINGDSDRKYNFRKEAFGLARLNAERLYETIVVVKSLFRIGDESGFHFFQRV
jgi:hypothetical protein